MSFLLEIAVFNLSSAILAAKAGADRIELCENPADGGTTPSFGMLKAVKEKINIPVFPIVRPRGGDFLYSDEEFDVMQQDILLIKQLGFPGAVSGILNQDGTIDIRRTRKLVELAHPLEITFHRAFDRACRPLQALEDIISSGCHRILTSGQFPTAFEGKDLIKELITRSKDRIIVMPGSGVRSDHIASLAESTGAKEFHSSARINVVSPMQFAQKDMREETQNISVDTSEIKRMRDALKQFGMSAG